MASKITLPIIRDNAHARQVSRNARHAYRVAKMVNDTGAMNRHDRINAHALNYLRTH